MKKTDIEKPFYGSTIVVDEHNRVKAIKPQTLEKLLAAEKMLTDINVDELIDEIEEDDE